jgi:Fe-S-cluster-containing hydrogenase component 2
MAIEDTGYLTIDELKCRQKMPTEARYKKGPVAVIECVQEIPCNPCEAACPKNAILIGEPITKLPVLDESACIGCGICIAKCSGLAIFVVDKSGETGMSRVSFPYEYFPLPQKGDTVHALSRSGEILCDAKVTSVVNPKSYDHTPVITIEVPTEMADEVRNMKPIMEEEFTDDDMLVCRCEEVTLGEIRQAIREGARDVTGVKRRVRAGMGLCQGRTCEKMVQQILCQELGLAPDKVGKSSARPPVRPITFGELAKGEVE